MFIGVTVPQVQMIAKKYQDAPRKDVLELLKNQYHEARLLALLILVSQYERTDDERVKKRIVDFYLRNRKRINNWDLVDLSAYKILGNYLLTHDRTPLFALAKEPHLWSQRIAIVSTYAFIRACQFDDTLKLAKIFLSHPHDLMHKATGWMLREVGKRDIGVLRTFLNLHATSLPRTMLRYAIEKMGEAERRKYRASK